MFCPLLWDTVLLNLTQFLGNMMDSVCAVHCDFFVFLTIIMRDVLLQETNALVVRKQTKKTVQTFQR